MARRRKYMFTNKKHPGVAIVSTILGSLSLLGLLYAILGSFLRHGQVEGRFGAGIALCFLYALGGTVTGLLGLRKEDSFHTFSVVGLILNGLSLAVCGFLLWLPA